MSTTPAHLHARAHRGLRRSLVGLTAVGLLGLAACGSPPATTGSGQGRTSDGTAKIDPKDCPVAALDKAKGPVKVNLWFSGLVDPALGVLQDMAKRYNASQDKVVVTTNNQGNAYAEGLSKYQGASSTPSQLPQIMYLEDTMLGELVDKGQVLPAEACMVADDFDPTSITPAARAAYSVDDVLYPGYMNVSTPILYYNKVHFQKAGLDPENPPKTIEEIEAAAKQLKDAGVSKKPFSFKADQWFVSTWLSGVGQDMVNNDNGRSKPASKATFDSAPAKELFGDLKRMNDEGLLNAFPVTDGSIDHYLALINEDSSMLVETSTASGTIAAALGGELANGTGGVKIDTSALDGKKIVPGSGEYPGLQSAGQIYASGGAFFMMNTSKPEQQAASWDFLKFMWDPENATIWHTEGGYLPVLKDIVDSPEVATFQDTELDGKLLTPAVEQLATADPDRSGPLIGPYASFQDILQGALEKVLFNGAEVDPSLASAQTEATALFKDYNG
ncbi:MAG: ABC-type sugar transport system, periplasmic component [Ilumatobacteraceae bacterium]|nr:ABC-type sugar transport system, periplasmic component [Ilumatobacteraceae bacterium]